MQSIYSELQYIIYFQFGIYFLYSSFQLEQLHLKYKLKLKNNKNVKYLILTRVGDKINIIGYFSVIY